MKRRTILTTIGISAFSGCSAIIPESANNRSTIKECPSFDEETLRTICPPGNNTINLDVQTSMENGASASITIKNTGDTPIEFDPTHWRLYRHQDKDWIRLDDGIYWLVGYTINPESSYNYILLSSDSPESASESIKSEQNISIIDSFELTEGTYAFSITVSHKSKNKTTRKSEVEVVSTFEL